MHAAASAGDRLCGNQIFNTTSMCAYATVSTRAPLLCFENSMKAIDSSKNQPNRRLKFGGDAPNHAGDRLSRSGGAE